MTTQTLKVQHGQHFNNFNVIRLVLATLVVVSHAFPLSRGMDDREPFSRLTAGQMTFGTVAVDMFFLISGMLITASWFRSASMQDFLYKRVLRIYPGFIVAVLFSASLIWGLCPEFRHSVNIRVWGQHLVHDFVLLDRSSLNGQEVFAGNPYPGDANGSLWTIPREFCCYLLIAALGMFCLFKETKSYSLVRDCGMDMVYRHFIVRT